MVLKSLEFHEHLRTLKGHGKFFDSGSG